MAGTAFAQGSIELFRFLFGGFFTRRAKVCPQHKLFPMAEEEEGAGAEEGKTPPSSSFGCLNTTFLSRPPPLFERRRRVLLLLRSSFSARVLLPWMVKLTGCALHEEEERKGIRRIRLFLSVFLSLVLGISSTYFPSFAAEATLKVGSQPSPLISCPSFPKIWLRGLFLLLFFTPQKRLQSASKNWRRGEQAKKRRKEGESISLNLQGVPRMRGAYTIPQDDMPNFWLPSWGKSLLYLNSNVPYSCIFFRVFVRSGGRHPPSGPPLRHRELFRLLLQRLWIRHKGTPSMHTPLS